MLTASTFFYVISLGHPSVWVLFAGIAMVWGAYGAASVIIYTIAMDIVRKGREGTDFTIQIVITHLSSLIVAVSSGKIADMIGYSGLFALEAALCAIVVIAAFFLYQDQTKESYAYTT
jgi:predicted MFS family arabinose efflux permease